MNNEMQETLIQAIKDAQETAARLNVTRELQKYCSKLKHEVWRKCSTHHEGDTIQTAKDESVNVNQNENEKRHILQRLTARRIQRRGATLSQDQGEGVELIQHPECCFEIDSKTTNASKLIRERWKPKKATGQTVGGGRNAA